jgi:UDP-N-acetylmuramyl pentapeptide phosphotransferase/UDP-N-acetylglucosamine-1-phosphate transferase
LYDPSWRGDWSSRVEFQLTVQLLIAFAAALVICALACALALALFPWFRSGERKAGDFKAEQSTGGMRIDTIKRKGREVKLHVRSNELPLVGGPALLLAITAACLGVGFWLGLSDIQWILMGILLFAMLGYGVVGFFDDVRKVYRGSGISEIQKFVGVTLVSLIAAIAFNRLIVEDKLTARLAYSPYKDTPFIGHYLVDLHFTWIIFFLLLTVTVASSTSLAVDFTDGMDGLTAGLMLSATLAFAVILVALNNALLLPAILVVLAMAGACLGYLPFNWPSSWRGANGSRRRARLIMGDTGSLALGGLLALVALISRLEFLLIIIGGVFLLEGLSALISARILVRFFRLALFHERFRAKRGFSHTEFPLPFLATPMHHHYELLGWDRKKLVYTTWLIGAFLALLGVASVIGAYTWERYLARFVGVLALFALWQVGTVTRSFFIGLAPTGAPKTADQPEEPRRLALFYGLPFMLFRWKLYACRDVTSVTEEELSNPGERLSLWQRMSVFDARALLGYYCYRAGAMRDTVRVLEYIPRPNLQVRPEINEMLVEARNRIAIENEVDLRQAALDAAAGQPANGHLADAPAETNAAGVAPSPLPEQEMLLWSAEGWTSAMTPVDPNADTDHVVAIRGPAPIGVPLVPVVTRPRPSEAPEQTEASTAENGARAD